jgi:hypothetical protein
MADEHPFDWFADDATQPTRSALLATLRDAAAHGERAHLLAVETIIGDLDGMSVEIGAEARTLIKRKLVSAGWADVAVDALFVDPRWRLALAAIEAAYAVAVEQARAGARQSGKDVGRDD